MAVQHILGFQSLPFEMLSFMLTLLAATVTPVFVLSKHWTHLPCGCIINCKQNTHALTSDGKKRKSWVVQRLRTICRGSNTERWSIDKVVLVGDEESKDK